MKMSPSTKKEEVHLGSLVAKNKIPSSIQKPTDKDSPNQPPGYLN